MIVCEVPRNEISDFKQNEMVPIEIELFVICLFIKPRSATLSREIWSAIP